MLITPSQTHAQNHTRTGAIAGSEAIIIRYSYKFLSDMPEPLPCKIRHELVHTVRHARVCALILSGRQTPLPTARQLLSVFMLDLHLGVIPLLLSLSKLKLLPRH